MNRGAQKFGKWLAKRGMSAAAFARSTGLAESAVSRYKSGAMRPKALAIAKISKATGGWISMKDWIEEIVEVTT